jgi:glucose dehydrogenase
MRRVGSKLRSALSIAVAAFLIAGEAAADNSSTDVEWPHFGGNTYFQRYSPLDQIEAKNLGKLTVAWTRPSVDVSVKGATAGEATLPMCEISTPGHPGSSVPFEGVCRRIRTKGL